MRRFELGLHTDVCSVHMAAGIPKPVLAGFFWFFLHDGERDGENL